MIELTGANFIGFGKSSKGTNKIYGLNPIDNSRLPQEFSEADLEEIHTTVELAEKAFKNYRKKSDQIRANFIREIANEIENLGDQLIQTACKETALPEARITGERGRTTGQLRLFASFIEDGKYRNIISEKAEPERQPLPKPSLMMDQIPLGPVVVFGASNFPLAFSVAGGDTAAALAAGCPVIFKAHPSHPNTSELVAHAIQKAALKTDMPNGVFSLLHGASHYVGESLVKAPGVKAVAFTGSFRGGKAIYDLAVRRDEPIPVYAEMGSINPVFLLPKRIEKLGKSLAEGLSQSVCLGVGQFCTNPGLIILHRKNIDLLEMMAEELDKQSLGTFLNTGIANAFSKGVNTLAENADVKKWTKNALPSPSLFSINAEDLRNNKQVLEEVFGPSTLAIIADHQSDMVDLIDLLPGQLTATLQAEKEDIEKNRELIENISYKVGRVILNAFPTGVEVSHAMVHGGPYPATSDPRTTSVGTQALYRFTRPICWQGF